MTFHEELAAEVVDDLPISVLVAYMEGHEGIAAEEAIKALTLAVQDAIYQRESDERTWSFLDEYPPFRDEPDEARSAHFLHVALEGYKQGYRHGWQDRGNNFTFERLKKEGPAGGEPAEQCLITPR